MAVNDRGVRVWSYSPEIAGFGCVISTNLPAVPLPFSSQDPSKSGHPPRNCGRSSLGCGKATSSCPSRCFYYRHGCRPHRPEEMCSFGHVGIVFNLDALKQQRWQSLFGVAWYMLLTVRVTVFFPLFVFCSEVPRRNWPSTLIDHPRKTVRKHLLWIAYSF